MHKLAMVNSVISTGLGTMLLLQSASAFGIRALAPRRVSRWATIATQININRAYHCSILLASPKAPVVEVSPSDHATTPIATFSQSGQLDGRLVKALQSQSMNITTPTPVQSHALPLLLNNYDVMASSATGSGKTLMFGLPLLNQLLEVGSRVSDKNNGMGTPTALIIAPTRELAVQTAGVLDGFATGDLRRRINVCLATGGSESRNQRRLLPGCNVLVGTPGRICQFLDERKLSLQQIKFLVIDEADRLLDMGFEPQLNRISRSLRQGQKQSVLCSATFPQGVQRLAADFLDPKYYFVSVGKVGSTHSTIAQRFEWVDLYRGSNNNNPKVGAVVRNVQQFWESNPSRDQSSVIVFTNTKDGAELYGKALSTKLGNKKRVVRVIHGDKPQSERNRALEDFRKGKVSVLVATDVAARGLDVDSIGLVVQADAPRDVDTYTHRTGRTGRAGRSGQAVTLIDNKSGFGLASGLVELLSDAGLHDSIPSWLQGMSHIANARSLEEDMKIQAGLSGTPSDASSESSASDVTNEEFSHQDFRRTADAGSYGVGKDVSYRSFEEDAYSSDVGVIELEQSTNETSSFSDEIEPIADTKIDALVPFKRKEPSKQLAKALNEITGKALLGDAPDKSILDAVSKRGQNLRFEYIGMYAFDDIKSLLMQSPSNDTKSGNKVKILMVAEKPSIAKSIAEALSPKRGPVQRRGISRALPVYEFTTDKFAPVNGDGKTKCTVRVTSVVGHVYSLGFDFDQNNGTRTDPRDYFSLPVTKKEESTSLKLRVVDHLRALAGDSDHLVLWLDCDPEGENIAHEVLAVTRRAIHSNAASAEESINRVHRAKFSAITANAIQDAFQSLQEPDADLSRSVDARQELDLRIGVALTRLLTWRCVNIARKRYPTTRMVSYGPCQTPALSFVFDRLREIEAFQTEKYWKVEVEAKLPDGKRYPLRWRVPAEHTVGDARGQSGKTKECATSMQQAATHVVDRASGSDIIVKSVSHTTESVNPPVGLNTVALLEAGSKAMGMSPKNVMNVAEKLYSAGFISYPRTETTRYDPNGFDARSLLREHSKHPDWGRSASYLLRARKSNKPPRHGKDAGDHPPITPLKSATREEVGGGAAWRVYEFVVRNFIGSLHNELTFTRTTASLALPDSSDSEFELDIVTVDSLGFADACRWVLRDIGASPGKNDMKALLQEGQRLQLTKAGVEEKQTRPPRFLQEHELIRLMDSNRIGTDASMAVHVSNIVDRGYAMLCDETGTPLRPPRPPAQRRPNQPRQVGRYMVPTPLGASFLDLFDHDATISEFDSPASLSHPSIRRQMEEEVKEIALGNIQKEHCLEKNLSWFEERYAELERTLTRDRVGEFGKGLVSTKEHLRYLEKLGAFEPKVKGAVPNKQQPKKKGGGTKRTSYKGRQKGRGQGQNQKRRARVKQ